MAEVSLCEDSHVDTEPNSLLQKLRNRITKSVQTKVDSILQDVQKLTDYDKLYLYLQLPPGPSSPEKSSLDIGSMSTAEHMTACMWIRNHLEEHTDTCLPKQDVYDAYKRYCDNLCGRPLSVANFGKIIREIFPNIKARRLGGRGQSKYCYSGLRRKSVVSMAPLPSLDLKMSENSELTDLVQSYNNDVINASCALICNWAEKILKRSFNNVVEVAQFLIQQHIINPRSANAELVLSMVLSENSLGGVQKAQKQPVDETVSKMPYSPEGGACSANKNKSTSPLLGFPQQPTKKRTLEPQKVASSPQVDALVAKMTPLLPRPTVEEKFLGSPIRLTPPVLAPKIISGPFTTVPSGTSVTVTTGINGTSLVSQPVPPPVIGMILPNRVSLETHTLPKASVNSTKEKVTSSGENKATKRRAESDSTTNLSSKRKRGRPRKVDSPKNVSKDILAEGRVNESPSHPPNQIDASSKDCVEPPVPGLSVTPIASHSSAGNESVPGETLNPLATPALVELQETPVLRATRNQGETAPIQVSVITDGRQTSALWTTLK